LEFRIIDFPPPEHKLTHCGFTGEKSLHRHRRRKRQGDEMAPANGVSLERTGYAIRALVL